jgi:hypothetical protein
MFIIDDVALARNAAHLYMLGRPTDSLADRVAAKKIIDFGSARAQLRPSELVAPSSPKKFDEL